MHLVLVGSFALDRTLVQRILPIALFLWFFIFFLWWAPLLQAATVWRTHKALQAPSSGGVTSAGLPYNRMG